MKTSLSRSDFAKIKVLHEAFEPGFYFNAAAAMNVLRHAGIRVSLRSTEKFLVKLSGGVKRDRVKILTEEATESSVEKYGESQFKRGIRLAKANKSYMFSRDDRNRFFDTYGEI